MSVRKGSVAILVMLAASAALLSSFGCNRISPLADRCAELPEGVVLPEGFYPLRGHYELKNESDNYEGWPRYIVSNRDNMIMTYVPTQHILMGGGTELDEVPARHVVVNHFYIDLHEVTNAQFNRFRKSTCKCNWCCDHDLYRDYWEPGLNNNHPVRNVSWWEARHYSKWASKSLPTEAQWEAAARGSDRRQYPWGNEQVSEQTRFLCNAQTGLEDYDGYQFTAPAMNFAAGVSPFGAFNMSGNVWEWCADNYDPGRYAYPSSEDPATGLRRGYKAFGDENYPNPLDKDIREARVGPLRGDERVIRGGSFADPVDRCRVTSRAGIRPGVHQHNVGFRCVLPLPPKECAGG